MAELKNKKILLIFPDNSPFPYHIATPLNIFCLGTYLNNQGYQVFYYDERVESLKQLYARLEEKPFLVGLTTMTSHQIKRAIAIAARIKKVFPRIPLVWGGVHPSMCPEQTLKSDWVDFVIIGEGEETLLALADKLQEGIQDFSQIAGLAWKKGSAIHINQQREFMDIETLPFPYPDQAASRLALYLKHETTLPVVGYQLSRGCRFRCRFCYSTFFHKGICRTKSKEKIKDELTKIQGLGVKKIIFYDDSLGPDRQMLYALTEIMGGLKMRWTASPRLEFFDQDLLERFQESGCEHLCFGIESFSDERLGYLGKGLTRKQILAGVKVMAQAQNRVTYLLMFGFPDESVEDLKEMLDFVDELRRLHKNAEVALQPYAPFPGTPLYEQAVKNGFQPPLQLAGWSRFTMDDVHTPWVKNKAQLRNLYLISFMAFRYDWLLSGFKLKYFYYLLHKIALWRWKKRFFGFCVESWLYRQYKRAWIIYQKITKG